VYNKDIKNELLYARRRRRTGLGMILGIPLVAVVAYTLLGDKSERDSSETWWLRMWIFVLSAFLLAFTIFSLVATP